VSQLFTKKTVEAFLKKDPQKPKVVFFTEATKVIVFAIGSAIKVLLPHTPLSSSSSSSSSPFSS
jgi:hypothetical protein